MLGTPPPRFRMILVKSIDLAFQMHCNHSAELCFTWMRGRWGVFIHGLSLRKTQTQVLQKIECNSLQGRHLWHFLFAKPCRYSSMTGSLSGVLFWVPAFILLIISSLSRSLKCSTRPGCFKFCQYIFKYLTKKSLMSPWQFHFSNQSLIRTFS